MKSFPLIYQHFKWSVCAFNLAQTTKCIFTINNKNNLHYSQTFYFQVSDFEKVFPAKFIQLLIFSKSTNFCSQDEMKSANLNFRYFIHVFWCSFIIYMGYINSLECSTDVIHLLGFPVFIKFCLFLGKFRVMKHDVCLTVRLLKTRTFGWWHSTKSKHLWATLLGIWLVKCVGVYCQETLLQ